MTERPSTGIEKRKYMKGFLVVLRDLHRIAWPDSLPLSYGMYKLSYTYYMPLLDISIVSPLRIFDDNSKPISSASPVHFLSGNMLRIIHRLCIVHSHVNDFSRFHFV